ncbi:MFS transporter [Methylobacterium tarhaniae]|uniref:MFS transporter n=1 Tax=Methylobacterium tarhaniae TaxID=1187852 RepID=UPI0009FAE3B7|nr:MFS transporter [Methylobacterium tarhaniae]
MKVCGYTPLRNIQSKLRFGANNTSHEGEEASLHHSFYWFLASQATISLGSRITRQALPLIAVVSLGASAGDLGVMQALLTGPAIIVGLVVKKIISRIGAARIAKTCLLVRGAVLAFIPAAHAAGILNLTILMGAVLLYGIVAAISDIAERSLLPAVVQGSAIVRANSLLATSDASAEIVGPLVMGMLVALMTPAYSIAADAAGFLIAFLCMRRVVPQVGYETHAQAGDASGWRLVRSNPELAGLVMALLSSTLANEAMRAVYTLHAIRTMGLSPFQLGVTFAFGGVGLLLGSTFIRQQKSDRLGRVSMYGLACNAIGLSLFPIAGASPAYGIIWLSIGQLISDFGLILFLISARSRIQIIVRINALPNVFALLAVGSGLVTMVGAVGGGFAAEAVGAGAALCFPPFAKLLGITILYASHLFCRNAKSSTV